MSQENNPSNNSRTLIIGGIAGVLVLLILLAILAFSGVISINLGDGITPEPSAVVQLSPNSTPTRPADVATETPTLTPSPTTIDTPILPTATCDPNNVTIEDFYPRQYFSFEDSLGRFVWNVSRT